jgi:hypothetical protein
MTKRKKDRKTTKMEKHELKTGVNSGRVGSSCSSGGTYRVTPVKHSMNSLDRRKNDGI